MNDSYHQPPRFDNGVGLRRYPAYRLAQNAGRTGIVMPAAEIAALLGDAKRNGRGWLCRCPLHQDHTPSLSIKDGDHVAILVKCFGGCDSRDVLLDLRRRGLLPDRNRDEGLRVEQPPPLPPFQNVLPPQSRMDSVLERSVPLLGTVGMTYLQGRGLDVELLDADAVRFLPGDGYFAPALVAIITAFDDAGRMLGLQFTPLKSDGSERSGDRYFLRGSRPGGGVVRLINDAEVTTELGVCEGVETGLGAMTTMRRAGRLVRPIWAALSAYNMPKLAPLPGIERLIIYADNGAAGAKLAKQLAALWADGRDVFIAPPTAGDWNTAP